MRLRARRPAGLLLLTALGLACRGEPTGPSPSLSAPEIAPAYDVSGGGGSEGSVTLPAPATNDVAWGAVAPMPVMDYTAGDFVRLRVTGQVIAQVNPKCTELGLPVWWGGGAWGPWGSPGGEFVVTAYYEPGRAMATDPSGQGTAQKVAYGWFDRAGTALVGRSGGGGSCGFPGLLLSGTQTVAYEVYPVAEVSASPTFLVRGDTSSLSAASHWQLANPVWVFKANDTTEVPAGPRWGQERCAGQMSCAYAPAGSGRVYLTGTILGVGVHAVGPILWVRDSIPDSCSSPAPAGAQGPQGAAGPVCPPDEPPSEEGIRLVLSARGGTFTTRPAKTKGDSTLTIDLIALDAAGLPRPNTSVVLSLDGVESTGGHTHGGTMPAGSLPSTPIVTNGAGRAEFVYLADEFGGDVRLTGETMGGASVSQSILVAVPNLIQLMESESVMLIGAVDAHPSNHWGTTAMVARLQDAAGSLWGRFARPMQVNDMSLVHGGKFDLNSQYLPTMKEHAEHRVGESADIRVLTFDLPQQKFMISEWERLGGRVFDERDTSQPHLHFRFR